MFSSDLTRFLKQMPLLFSHSSQLDVYGLSIKDSTNTLFE